MAKNFEWLKQLIEVDKVDPDEVIKGDARLIAKYCGVDTLIKILQHLTSMQLYISEQQIKNAYRYYVQKHYDGTNIKELAVQLGVSEMFIREIVRELLEEDKR
ncbi:hypothetical protein HRbin37_02112 [bacterium HR37]|nr:hypothetical protein HRbin37_02112 [bacterium HR37]